MKVSDTFRYLHTCQLLKTEEISDQRNRKVLQL